MNHLWCLISWSDSPGTLSQTRKTRSTLLINTIIFQIRQKRLFWSLLLSSIISWAGYETILSLIQWLVCPSFDYRSSSRGRPLRKHISDLILIQCRSHQCYRILFSWGNVWLDTFNYSLRIQSRQDRHKIFQIYPHCQLAFDKSKIFINCFESSLHRW